jgi:hypothetical protein
MLAHTPKGWKIIYSHYAYNLLFKFYSCIRYHMLWSIMDTTKLVTYVCNSSIIRKVINRSITCCILTFCYISYKMMRFYCYSSLNLDKDTIPQCWPHSFLYARKNFGHIMLNPLVSVRLSVRPLAIWFPEHNLSSIWPTIFKLHRMIVHIA